MIDRLSSPYWQQGVAAAAGCVLAVPILVVAGLPGPALVCMTAAFAVTLALLVATAGTPDEPGAAGADADTPPRGGPAVRARRVRRDRRPPPTWRWPRSGPGRARPGWRHRLEPLRT